MNMNGFFYHKLEGSGTTCPLIRVTVEFTFPKVAWVMEGRKSDAGKQFLLITEDTTSGVA